METESAIVASHRAGFLAGAQPMPAEAATEVGADPTEVRGPMQMLAYTGTAAFVLIAALVAVFA